MAQEYRQKNTSVSLINYHFVWGSMNLDKVEQPSLSGWLASRIVCVVKGASYLSRFVLGVPRRRRKVLAGEVETRLKELIYETAQKLDCKVLALEVMPEHVHLFLNCPPTTAPNQIMFRIKGVSARFLRKDFPHLLKMPSM